MAIEYAARPHFGDLVQAIGNTPLVELKRLSPKPGVRLFAKLEYFNPTGSVKDRVARALIDDAEERGAIAPGQVILEPTSGNTGIALAMICARKGYQLHVVLPDNVTSERVDLLRMYGAQIIPSPGELGTNGSVALAQELAASDARYYTPYQYGNAANPGAHYNGTALEILEELDEVTAFVAGLGTGGTLMGNGRRLKEELLPPFDQCFSAFLDDLEARGLLRSTLVVCMGEFGRTPNINNRGANPGRDHFPRAWSLMTRSMSGPCDWPMRNGRTISSGHARTAAPSSSTVHAPQTPCSQPT